jgi:translation initiation factor IF-1
MAVKEQEIEVEGEIVEAPRGTPIWVQADDERSVPATAHAASDLNRGRITYRYR